MTRGGYRKGSGRPKGTGKYNETTKPIRVPESLIKEVRLFILEKQKENKK
jgi:DNA polymerase V